MRSVLLLAYHYPPVGSRGIPGVQRAKRFLRYGGIPVVHVLTLKTNCYPPYVDIDSKMALPINSEQIHRTGIFDVFGCMVRIRNFFLNKQPEHDIGGQAQTAFTFCNGHHKPGKLSGLKDAVSSILTYPDFASPWIIPATINGLKIINKCNIEGILATGMPWSSMLIGYLLKNLTGKKLILDFRDPWVGNPYVTKDHLSLTFDKKFESLVVHKADLVITNTESLKTEMLLRYPKIAAKLMILPNGYDPQDFVDIPQTRLPERKFIITHAGLLYSKRDPKSFLEALADLKTRHPEVAPMIQFCQIGGTDLDYDMRRYCEEKGILENILVHDYMQHKECLGFMAASDALLIIQPDTKSQIPSKLYEYVYLGKPIVSLAEKDGDLASIVQDYGLGEVFGPGETDLLAEYLYKLATRKMDMAPIQPGDAAKAKFDARNLLAGFRERLLSL